MPRPKITLHKN